MLMSDMLATSAELMRTTNVHSRTRILYTSRVDSIQLCTLHLQKSHSELRILYTSRVDNAQLCTLHLQKRFLAILVDSWPFWFIPMVPPRTAQKIENFDINVIRN